MKILTILALLFGPVLHASENQNFGEKTSIDFFFAVKHNENDKADMYARALAEMNPEDLRKELNTDNKTLAFWINVYNTEVQYILKKDPSKFEDRGAFFKAKQIHIAGEWLSLDIIEHGILRKSKSKVSLGFFRKISVGSFERKFRINKLDPRIHYALNCGALSCPPIVPYHSADIDRELDESVENYLQKYCEVKEHEVYVPVLFSWFRGDFGKKKGIHKFLCKYGITSESDKKKELKFLSYDWTLALDPYKN